MSSGSSAVKRDRDATLSEEEALVTLLVDDLERHVSELAERGLATGPVDTVPGLFRRTDQRSRG